MLAPHRNAMTRLGTSELPHRESCYLKLLVQGPLLFAILFCTGCGLITRRFAGPAQDGSVVAMPNPMIVRVADVDFAWHQVVDMVDDYFDIASEQQVHEVNGVLMPGSILTDTKSGATCVECLMRDSTPGYERLHSSLQSIRRYAQVRVTPAGGGFEVGIEVYKELEDVSQPEYATVTSSVRRHDGSLVTSDLADPRLGPVTLGWIPLGRDETLEQAMLRNLHARMFEVAEVVAR